MIALASVLMFASCDESDSKKNNTVPDSSLVNSSSVVSTEKTVSEAKDDVTVITTTTLPTSSAVTTTAKATTSTQSKVTTTKQVTTTTSKKVTTTSANTTPPTKEAQNVEEAKKDLTIGIMKIKGKLISLANLKNYNDAKSVLVPLGFTAKKLDNGAVFVDGFEYESGNVCIQLYYDGSILGCVYAQPIDKYAEVPNADDFSMLGIKLGDEVTSSIKGFNNITNNSDEIVYSGGASNIIYYICYTVSKSTNKVIALSVVLNH